MSQLHVPHHHRKCCLLTSQLRCFWLLQPIPNNLANYYGPDRCVLGAAKALS